MSEQNRKANLKTWGVFIPLWTYEPSDEKKDQFAKEISEKTQLYGRVVPLRDSIYDKARPVPSLLKPRGS